MLEYQAESPQRIKSLKKLLDHERDITLSRVREYRAAQDQEALPPPSDELDTARALADVETHAGLIERAEDRLRAIDFAVNLLERGRYGVCAQCGDEIPVERLQVLPFAAYCVDCQEKRNHFARARRFDEPFVRRWQLPEELGEPTEASRDEMIEVSEEGPEEPATFAEEPFGAGTVRRRRRGRKPAIPSVRKTRR
jgi:DnaK suppressor protein